MPFALSPPPHLEWEIFGTETSTLLLSGDEGAAKFARGYYAISPHSSQTVEAKNQRRHSATPSDSWETVNGAENDTDETEYETAQEPGDRNTRWMIRGGRRRMAKIISLVVAAVVTALLLILLLVYFGIHPENEFASSSY